MPHSLLRSLGLCPLKPSALFYLLLIFLMALYCVYITNQSSSIPFQFRFNEPLSVRFVGEKLFNKLKKQDNERANSLLKLTDLEKMKRQNSELLLNISAFGTDFSNPEWAETICIGGDAKRCGGKLKNLETRLRSAPPYKTLACIIQKNMSTVLQAIMCFLFNEKKFREANRVLSRECHDVRFCVGKNEHNAVSRAEKLLNMTNSKMKDWLYLAIVRDPIDRFLSGYVDKCIRKPHDPKKYCNGCDDEFISQPNVQPYYVREGEPGPILNCIFSPEFRDRKRFEPQWTRVVSGTPKLLTRNEDIFSKNDYALQEESDSGEYSLQIKVVRFERDNGQFFCSLLDRETGDQILSTPATIMVVVPPSSPSITVQPSQAVKENEFVTLHCESNGGNPPPKFSWIFNNNTVVPSSWYQNKVEAAPRATSVSILQWRVNAEDNGAYLTCQIWNEAMQKDEFRTVETNRLNVLFSPRVRAGPISEYNVEEGEPVDLVCEAEGNPSPTKFEWVHVSSGEVKEGMHWKFTASRRTSGDFRCTAQNAIDTGASKITMNVFYGPEVNLPPVLNPAEGDRFVLECEVSSNPAPEQIMWQGPNGFSHLGSKLVIESIQRSHTGNYTCTAENSFALYSASETPIRRTGSKTTSVEVKRKPGTAIISTSHQFVNVGESFTLSCTADDLGSPTASFKWATPRTQGIHSQHLAFNRQTLIVDQARLSDNGVYKCVPYNEIGNGEPAVMKITVVEPAKITQPLPTNKLMTSGDIAISIECESTGYPQPKIHWRKDGLSINEAGNPHWIIENTPTQASCNNGEYCPWTVVSSLRFDGKVQWNDKGNYTCIAENGDNEGLAQSSSVVSVIHEPHMLNEKYPSEGLAAGDVGSSASLACIVSARPEPKITWMRDGEIVVPSSKYAIHASKIYNKIDEYESILEIEDVENGDLGAYRCQATNGKGNVGDLIVQLQQKSVPQIPKNIQLYESAPTWTIVSWKPGFDGGDHQYYELEYRIANPTPEKYEKSVPTTFILDERNATSISVFEKNENEFQKVNLLIHNLTLLTPMTMYWYRIRSRNAYGYSEWSPIASTMTLDVKEDPNILAPTSLVYFANDQKIVFEPLKSYNNTCLLLYVGHQAEANGASPSLWRTLGCFPTDQPIKSVEVAEHYKARFCDRYDLSVCSPSIEILVANNMSSKWPFTIGAPIAIIVVLILLALIFVFLCCRMRVPMRKEKIKRNINKVIGNPERPDVNASISDRKNTIVHGSQNDSGVFTLGSQQNNNHMSGNPGENVGEVWPSSSDEHLNCNNDEYSDNSNKFMECPQHYGQPADYQPYFEGYIPTNPEGQIPTSSDEQTDGSSDTASCSASGSRRVMREIIV
ncbi:hypothetical protein FO519_000428 [Halicephalobus sp. NKZ332]|nr:hypothetical protein FO519_000428 [Halicephalobus sp. NKZ332]